MGLSFVRTIILYGCVIAAMRMMGKRTIGEMSTTELVVSIMISDLATVPMQSKETPLFDGIVPIFTLVFLELVFAFLILKNKSIRRLFVGKSCGVVKGGVLLEDKLAKLRMTVDDLEEQIRIAGYTDLSEVSEVIVETNGQVSVVPKEGERGVTLSDMGIQKQQSKVPFIVIADGKIQKEELKQSGVKMDFIEKTLRDEHIGGVSDVLYLSVSDGKKVYLQRKKRK